MDQTEFITKLVTAVNGMGFNEAVSGLVSTLMTIIVAASPDVEVQDKLMEVVMTLIKEQMVQARAVVATGSPLH